MPARKSSTSVDHQPLQDKKMISQIEHEFCCPHCMALISMLLDPGAPAQEYIEDCEVCCRPLAVRCEFQIQTGRDAELVVFEVRDDSS